MVHEGTADDIVCHSAAGTQGTGTNSVRDVWVKEASWQRTGGQGTSLQRTWGQGQLPKEYTTAHPKHIYRVVHTSTSELGAPLYAGQPAGDNGACSCMYVPDEDLHGWNIVRFQLLHSFIPLCETLNEPLSHHQMMAAMERFHSSRLLGASLKGCPPPLYLYCTLQNVCNWKNVNHCQMVLGIFESKCLWRTLC